MISQNSECMIFEPLVSVMLDDELTQTEQERLQVHLDRCPSCQHLLDTFSQVDESVGLLSGVPTAGNRPARNGFGRTGKIERPDQRND